MGVVDLHGDFGTLYGLRRNFVCLIRPDGHVGFVGPADRHRLADYLGLLCDPAEVQKLFAGAHLG